MPTGKGLPKSVGPKSSGFVPKLKRYTVATLPSASVNADCLVVVTNGAAGSEILAWSDGTNWKRSDTGATVAAA